MAWLVLDFPEFMLWSSEMGSEFLLFFSTCYLNKINLRNSHLWAHQWRCPAVRWHSHGICHRLLHSGNQLCYGVLLSSRDSPTKMDQSPPICYLDLILFGFVCFPYWICTLFAKLVKSVFSEFLCFLFLTFSARFSHLLILSTLRREGFPLGEGPPFQRWTKTVHRCPSIWNTKHLNFGRFVFSGLCLQEIILSFYFVS